MSRFRFGGAAVFALVLLTSCSPKWPFHSRPRPEPAPPAVRADSTPPPPDLSLPPDGPFASDSVGVAWALRLARAYDQARTFGADPRLAGAPLDARLARMAFALGRAETDSARSRLLPPTPWLPLAPRALPTQPTPPTAATPPAEWARPRYPVRAVRLASAIIVWSTLRHEHAYRMLADEEWDATLARVIPLVLDAPDSIAYATVLRDLLTATSDSRVTLDDPTLDARLGAGVLPVAVRSIEGQMVVTGVAAEAAASGVQVGDIIVRIDNDPIERKFDAAERLFSASNAWARRRDAVQLFRRGPIGSTATLQLQRPGARGRSESRDVVVTRVAGDGAPAVLATPRAIDTVGAGIAIVDAAQLTDGRVDSLRALDAARRPRALIVDLRGGVQPHAVTRLTRWLLDQPTVRTMLTRRTIVPCADCDARFTQEWYDRLTADSVPRFTGRVAVLIDERVDDLAEVASLALVSAAGATPIGAPSAGAVGPQARLTLPGGFAVRYPWADVRWADGRQLQRVGLTPLVDVRQTVAGIRAGRDDVLDAAVRWLGAATAPASRRR
jgi:C-terminal processing protease CtpA/Prc